MNATVLFLVAAASMGADSDARDVAMSVESVAAPTVTLDAMPYTRTVSCGSYTLTGDYTGSVPTWSASPSGASGSCSDTGGGNFSCVVDVDPDAVGEGVETITVTAGSATDTETIGFYVDGEHSCFLAQSVNGSYNSGLSDLDAVTTWENLGSSALDVTQGGAATLKPTFRTGIVGGQPVVRFDGGDFIAAAAVADWPFLNNGGDFTVEDVFRIEAANPNNYQVRIATQGACGSGGAGNRGFCAYYDDRTADNDRSGALINNDVTIIVSLESANDATPAQKFSLVQTILDDDGGAGVDLSQFCNGSACGTGARSGAFSSSNPGYPLTLGAEPNAVNDFTGDLFRVLIYQSALTSTQRGINEAVDEWALGGSLPVTP